MFKSLKLEQKCLKSASDDFGKAKVQSMQANFNKSNKQMIHRKKINSLPLK